MTERDFTTLPDDVLHRTIEILLETQAHHEHWVQELRNEVALAEAELSRRQIEKLPIRVGDILLVTPDMFPKYAKSIIGTTKSFEVAINDIARFDGKEVKVWCGARGSVTIEDAITMHNAYLAAHESEATE